jgi:hypothetical protein
MGLLYIMRNIFIIYIYWQTTAVLSSQFTHLEIFEIIIVSLVYFFPDRRAVLIDSSKLEIHYGPSKRREPLT